MEREWPTDFTAPARCASRSSGAQRSAIERSGSLTGYTSSAVERRVRVRGAAAVAAQGACDMRPFEQRTSRDEIDGLLERTGSSDAAERAEALRSLCPCHVKRNDGRVWDRILALANDPSAKVRSHVFHLLADGSPRLREADVVAAIERLQQDPDEKLRRRARKLLAHYRRGGRINVL
jgi:hypothetical protein